MTASREHDHTHNAATEKEPLPLTLAGHWNSADGREMALRYENMPRERLMGGARSDFEVANAIYMVDRHSLGLLPAQTMAKERIRWLSVQLAIAQGTIAKLASQ